MKHLIDKDALVAEINNRIDICNIKKQSCPVNTQVEAICDNKIHAYKELLSFIDSQEVKEVDLEKEIQQHINDCLDIKFPTTDIKMIAKDVEFTARRFFKLGLKAQKGE